MVVFITETRNKKIRIIRIEKNRNVIPITGWLSFEEYDKIKELVRFGTGVKISK